MSWIQDSELLALYAIAGALSTPLLVSTGGNHEITLFTYLLILDLAVLVLVALRPWSRLLFISFVGTVIFIFGWWSSFYSQDQATRTAFFLCCFFIPFSLVAARIALAWIFIYYGAGKLFGSFNGPGIHRTALYFSQTAHLHPGGLFAVLGGLIEFGGGVALALGLFSRLAGVALFGDMVMAMITVTWATGINSVSNPPGYQLNLALAVLALVAALLASGRFSLDAVIERRVAGA